MTNTTGYREYHVKMYQDQKAEDLSQAIRDRCGKISGSNVNRVKLCNDGDTSATLIALVNEVINLTAQGPSVQTLDDIKAACNSALAGN